jgi:hypothetical protein
MMQYIFVWHNRKKRDVKLKGRKYTTENKILALAFYKQSRRAYSKLREFFALPTL